MKIAVWDVTSKCNLRCHHCYNADMYFTNNQCDDLNIEQITKMMHMLKAANFTHLQLLGGEPFCSPYIMKILEQAKHFEFEVFVTTNGTIMPDNFLQAIFQSSISQLSISLESHLEKKNDVIRGIGSYKKAVDNFKKIVSYNAQRKFRIGVSFTLTKINYKDMLNMIQMVSELGGDYVIFSDFIDSGNGKKYSSDLQEDINEIQKYMIDYLPQIAKQYPHIQIQLDVRPYIVLYLRRRYRLKNLLYTPSICDCLAGENMWYITANGNLHPCNVMINQEIPDLPSELIQVDNINVKDFSCFKDMLENDYYKKFLYYKNYSKVHRKQICMDCELRNECFPCFIKLCQEETIPECEYIKKIESAYYRTMKNVTPILSENIVLYPKKDGSGVIWDIKNDKEYTLSHQEYTIIDAVDGCITFSDIYQKCAPIKESVVYKFLHDCRFNDIVIF